MQLKRSIGLVGLTFVAVSGIVGSGWLFAPLLTSQQAGPAAIISWIIGGAAMLILALCFAEVTGVLPVAGGIARLPHFTHGSATSSVLGWSAWIGYNTAAPIETIAMLEYLGHDLPWMFTGDATKGHLTPAGCAVAVVVLALFVFINALGAAIFAKANTVITWIKLLVPVAVGAAILWSRFDAQNLTAAGGFAPYGIKGIFAAVSTGGIIFALIGFRHAIDLAGEVKRPRITIPLALTLSLVICVGIYVLLQVAFIGALTPAHLKDGWAKLHFGHDLGPVAGVAAGLGIGWMSVALYTGATVCPFGGGLVAMGSTARLGYGLSQNGFFPYWLQKLSRRGVPLRSLLVNFVFGGLIVALLPFKEAVAINGAAITLSFTGGPLALDALRRQMPDAPRPFRLPAAGLFAATGFWVATLIVYWSGWDTTWRLGLVVLLGLILYAAKMVAGRVRATDLDLVGAVWLLPFGVGIALLSYFGDYGGGQAWLVFPWDVLTAGGLSVGVFLLANRCRLANEKAELYRKEFVPPPISEDAVQ